MIVEARRDVITLRGSLAQNEWPTIQAAAKVLLEEYPHGIIIDGSLLTECTEDGTRTFLDAVNYIHKYDARIIVAGLPANALEVIRGVRAVISRLPIAPTVEDARSSLGLEELTKKSDARGLRVIAVLLVGNWNRAVEVGCQVAERRRDEIHLIDLLRVPRNMPLAAPMPEAEALARRELDDAERAVKRCKITSVRHVERVRTLAEGVQHVLSVLRPGMLILSVQDTNEESHELMNQVMPNLLAEPPCEIIYIRRPAGED
jgi:malonyl CoA-acyl carrier protein transacylase